MNRKVTRFVLYCDVVWLLLALGVSLELAYDAMVPYEGSFYRLLAVAAVSVWIALFSMIRLDCFTGGGRSHVVFSKIAIGPAFLMLVILTLAYLARLYYSPLMLFYFANLLFAGFLAIRVGPYVFLCRRHKNGV